METAATMLGSFLVGNMQKSTQLYSQGGSTVEDSREEHRQIEIDEHQLVTPISSQVGQVPPLLSRGIQSKYNRIVSAERKVSTVNSLELGYLNWGCTSIAELF